MAASNPPAQPAYTQPAPPKAPPADITRRANPAILTAPNTRYTFHTLNLPRTNGETQRIFVGIPHTPPPAQGYPALYALDGNALLELLTPQTLSRYRQPPVLVLIGYPTEQRFDTARRAYDYTPPNPDGKPMPDPLTAGRQNGGAPELLQFIETQPPPPTPGNKPCGGTPTAGCSCSTPCLNAPNCSATISPPTHPYGGTTG